MDAPVPSVAPAPNSRVLARDWYSWGIDGHDLFSIYADQTDNYHAVMPTTALPATGLDLRNQYRGKMDTVLEEIPQAVLYETYPEQKEDEARRQEFELT